MQTESKKALESALRSLTARPHFSKELKEKLQRKNFEIGAIEEALEFCTKWGFLNDDEEKKRFVARMQKKGYGKKRIAVELKRKSGFSFEESIDEEEGIKELLETKLKKINWSDRKEKERGIRALLRRGFSYETIATCIKIF